MDIPIFQNPDADGKSFFLNGNDVGIVLIHGFTATTVEVRALGEFFNKAGFSVSAPLLPGHGTTPEDMNRCKWIDWITVVEKAYRELTKICKVVFVGGESMGGVLSLYVGSEIPEIRGLLLYAPALKAGMLKYARYIRLFKKILPKKNYDPDTIWQGYTVYPLNAAAELYKLQQIVKRRLPQIKTPAVIFQGRLDQTIDPASAQLTYDNLGSPDKSLKWYDKSTHCIIMDREFDSVAVESVAFINRQI
jgi:carboxylesterase